MGKEEIHIRALQHVATALGDVQGFIDESCGFFSFLLIVVQAGEFEEDIGFIYNIVNLTTNVYCS